MNRSGAARLDAAPNRLRGGNPLGKQAVNRASIARTDARRADTFPKEGASRRDYGSAGGSAYWRVAPNAASQ